MCVLQRRRRAFVDSFPTHPSNIFESVRVARGGRSPSGTHSKDCDFTGWIYSPMSHQIGKKKPSRESSCVPRGESAASPVSPRIASLNPIPRVPNRGSGQWWPGARMENVVCCVCDAVGLSMPAGSRGRDGEIELVPLRNSRGFVDRHAAPESARFGARDASRARYAPGNDATRGEGNADGESNAPVACAASRMGLEPVWFV